MIIIPLENKKINIKISNIRINFNNYNVDFISNYNINYDLSGNLKSILSNNKKKEQFKTLYTKFDNRIKDIRFIENKVAVELVNLTHTINIKSMGKGFQTYLKIIASMVAGNKYIIIDEIENGMHFESVRILLENILSLSREYNLQFFITTHNKELLEILNCILNENNYKNSNKLTDVYEINFDIKRKNGKILPNERATILYENNFGTYIVYNTKKGKNSKSGYLL